MSLERAAWFTLHRVIFGDMVLNWVLTVVLIAIPGVVDNVIGTGPVLPHAIYRVIGVPFLGFAAWQLWRIRIDRLTPGDLVFAALMAEIPVILLAAALLFLPAPLYPAVRIILWAGNVYMLILGAWYLYLARWIQKRNNLPG